MVWSSILGSLSIIFSAIYRRTYNNHKVHVCVCMYDTFFCYLLTKEVALLLKNMHNLQPQLCICFPIFWHGALKYSGKAWIRSCNHCAIKRYALYNMHTSFTEWVVDHIILLYNFRCFRSLYLLLLTFFLPVLGLLVGRCGLVESQIELGALFLRFSPWWVENLRSMTLWDGVILVASWDQCSQFGMGVVCDMVSAWSTWNQCRLCSELRSV